MTNQYVLDTSVLIQGYIREPHTNHVLAMLNQLTNPDTIVLHTSEFSILECTNILWKKVRFEGMPAETAQKAVRDLTELPITIHLASPYAGDALKIGLAGELAIYDSIYIALAKSLGFSLITADLKQERIAIDNGVIIKPISDFKLS
jgi:predicted nucleic acid-binding protein